MRRQLRQNLLLAAAVALLAALAWAVVSREQAPRNEPLTAIDTTRVQELQVRSAQQPPRRFQRQGEGWQMREPFDLPAHGEAVARLLAIATAPPRQWLDAAALDPRKIGLDPPQAVLQLDAQTIEIGAIDALRGDRYVRSGGRIALMPDRFSAWLLAPPEAELGRRLSAPLARIDSVSIDGKIHNELITAWSTAVTRQVAAATATAPDSAVAVQLNSADGRIDYRVWRDAEGRYAALRSEPPLLYPLEESQVQQLLPPAGER
jgi:hypothetical protein